MSVFENTLYLLFVGLLFILFFIIISVFGYFFLILINKRLKNNRNKVRLTFLESIFSSFGIGISIYLCISVLLCTFGVFNFLTAYVSILLFDVNFAIIYLIKNSNKLREFNIIKTIKKLLLNKDNATYLLILISILTLGFLLNWSIINESRSLLAVDPWNWYQEIYLVLNEGQIQTGFLSAIYPQGFSIFGSACLLIYPDALMVFYFLKMLPIYTLSLFLLISFTVLKRLFRRKSLVFLSLILILASRYFIFRSITPYPTTISLLLIVISFIFIINKYHDAFLGFFISSIYLIHSLSFFYYGIVLSLYFFYKILLSLKKRDLFVKQFFSISLLLLLTILLFIPWVLCTYLVYNRNIFEILNSSIGYIRQFGFSILGNLYPLNKQIPIIILGIIDLSNLSIRDIIWIFNYASFQSINILFTASVMSIFIPHKKYLEKKRHIDLLNFSKFAIIIIFITYSISLMKPDVGFFVEFDVRTLEIFCLPIIILAVSFIDLFIRLFRRLSSIILNKYKLIKKSYRVKKNVLRVLKSKFVSVIRKRLNVHSVGSKIFKLDYVVIIFTIIYAFTLFKSHTPPHHNYYVEDEIMDPVLYLRDKAPLNSRVIKPPNEYKGISKILIGLFLMNWQTDINSSYTEIIDEIKTKNPDYIIYKRNYYENKSIDNLIANYTFLKGLLINERYILYEYRD